MDILSERSSLLCLEYVLIPLRADNIGDRPLNAPEDKRELPTAALSSGMAVNAIKKINFLICKTVKTFKKTTKSIDRTTSKAIRSLTKRRGRK